MQLAKKKTPEFGLRFTLSFNRSYLKYLQVIKKNVSYLFLLASSVIINCPEAFGQCNKDLTGTYSDKNTYNTIFTEQVDSSGINTLSIPNFNGGRYTASLYNLDCTNNTFYFNCIASPTGNLEGTGIFSCDFNSIYITSYLEDLDGGKSGPYYDTLHKDGANLINIKTTPACSGCNGTALAVLSGFTNANSINYSYQWSNGQTSLLASGLCPGTYSFSVSSNCPLAKGIAYVTIPSSTEPAVNTLTTLISDVSCFGDDNGSAGVTSIGGTAPYKYQWFPNGLSDSVEFNLTAGVYTVITSDANSCANVNTVQITQPSPLELTIPSSFSINAGQAIELSPTVNGGTEPYIFIWNGNTGNSPYTISPSNTTNYSIEITDKNGCSASAETTVDISDIFIPTAFSPNNDGHNDLLYVRGPGIKDMSFNIYDRWGNLVYTSTNINDGWDGNFKGHSMNAGTYMYYLQATLNDGTNISQKGNVLLVR